MNLPTACAAILLAVALPMQRSPGPPGKLPAPIRRLLPSAFPELPPLVRRTLQARGCVIPQAKGFERPHNVIRGAFMASDREEVAVLCSIKATSSILILEERSGRVVGELARRSDADFLQSVQKEPPYFCRYLSTKNQQTLLVFLSQHASRTRPSITHDGIDDAFIEKYSSIWYWDGKEWLRFQGSD
jgi:hypothetical protein